MGDLQFNIYFCGMSEETFSEQIMIYKPISTITRCFTEAALQKLEIATVGELIDYLKRGYSHKGKPGNVGTCAFIYGNGLHTASWLSAGNAGRENDFRNFS